MLTSLGEKLTDEEVDQLLRQMPPSSDGAVNYEGALSMTLWAAVWRNMGVHCLSEGADPHNEFSTLSPCVQTLSRWSCHKQVSSTSERFAQRRLVDQPLLPFPSFVSARASSVLTRQSTIHAIGLPSSKTPYHFFNLLVRHTGGRGRSLLLGIIC